MPGDRRHLFITFCDASSREKVAFEFIALKTQDRFSGVYAVGLCHISISIKEDATASMGAGIERGSTAAHGEHEG